MILGLLLPHRQLLLRQLMTLGLLLLHHRRPLQHQLLTLLGERQLKLKAKTRLQPLWGGDNQLHRSYRQNQPRGVLRQLLLCLHQQHKPTVPIKVGHRKVSRWKLGYGNPSHPKQVLWHQQTEILRQQQLLLQTAGIHQFKTGLKKQHQLQLLQQRHRLTAGMCQFKHAVLALNYRLPKRYRQLVHQAYQ
jgi:hypothetical protein